MTGVQTCALPILHFFKGRKFEFRIEFFVFFRNFSARPLNLHDVNVGFTVASPVNAETLSNQFINLPVGLAFVHWIKNLINEIRVSLDSGAGDETFFEMSDNRKNNVRVPACRTAVRKGMA